MFDISRSLKDELVFDEVVYPLNLAFNNVLKLFEMLHDEQISVYARPYLALKMLLVKSAERDSLLGALDIETAVKLYQAIVEEHVMIMRRNDEPEYDLAGNIIERKETDDDEDVPRFYSLKYDGDYIYSSFLQAYQIDLIESQGVLHWKKFNALLNGLPKDTKFAEVLKIRSWKPQKGDTQEYIRKMRELQKEYALPEEVDY